VVDFVWCCGICDNDVRAFVTMMLVVNSCRYIT